VKTGNSQQQVREALLDAFRNANQMKIVVSDADIGVPFAEFLASDGATYSSAVFSLLDWAESQNKLVPLLQAARRANSGNPKLRAVLSRLGVLEAKYAAHRPGETLGEAERVVFKSLGFEDAGVWLDDMARKRRAVCRIEPQQGSLDGYGTGFLVAPGVLMTNDHVANTFYEDNAPKKAANVICRFDYETGPGGPAANPGTQHKLHPTDWRIARSAEADLDFALLRLEKPAGDDVVAGAARGFLTPDAYDFLEGEGLVILQHPMGEPLKLALGPVDEQPWGADRVKYRVNTQGGSSGSPCFTQQRKVGAIHHYGLDTNNRGVLLSSILKHLKGLPDAEKKKVADAGLAHLLA
jgi:hypothetical protein